MDYDRDLPDVVETLRSVGERGRRCTLLIGAGCSVTAGIPLASEFVAEVKELYRRSYDRAHPKTYPKVMAALSPAERRRLIADYVDKAGINWAHIGIAELMKQGYVDRVLTTNFDPLVMRAAALTGEYPAIYDFAASQAFSAADLPEKAVFHLHGQRTGFALMNTPEEVQRYSKAMAPVFEDAGRGRCWLVVGYSGENDPVFDHLASVDRFDDRLYWVAYRDHEPPAHVRERLLEGDKYAFYVRGYDADSFFIRLARELACFPPNYVGRPFTHLEAALREIKPYPVHQLSGLSVELMAGDRGSTGTGSAGSDQAGHTAKSSDRMLRAGSLVGDRVESDITGATRRAIKRAISEYERKPSSPLSAWASFLSGDYETVVKTAALKKVGEDFNEPAYWALIEAGRAALSRSQQRQNGADLAEACDMFERAAKIKPRSRYAYEDWGTALALARRFPEANAKFRASHKANSKNHRLLATWGRALVTEASWAWDDEKRREQLFSEAAKKYRAALRLRDGDHVVLNDWGNALASQARTAPRKRVTRLLSRAVSKYEAALGHCPPDFAPVVLLNLSYVQFDLAFRRRGSAKRDQFRLAAESLRSSLRITPEDPRVTSQLAMVLAVHADDSDGDEAANLYSEAIELWQHELKLAPERTRNTLQNLALASMRATRVSSEAATATLLAEAERYLDEADAIGGVYRFARALLAAYQKDEDKTRGILEGLRDTDENQLERWRGDLRRDFGELVDRDWFQDLLRGMPR